MYENLIENLRLTRNKLRQLKKELSNNENLQEQVRGIEKIIFDCQFLIDSEFCEYVPQKIKVFIDSNEV